MAIYGYCRVSTHSQRIERQETNILLHNALEGKYGNLRILQSKYSFTAD